MHSDFLSTWIKNSSQKIPCGVALRVDIKNVFPFHFIPLSAVGIYFYQVMYQFYNFFLKVDNFESSLKTLAAQVP